MFYFCTRSRVWSHVFTKLRTYLLTYLFTHSIRLRWFPGVATEACPFLCHSVAMLPWSESSVLVMGSIANYRTTRIVVRFTTGRASSGQPAGARTRAVKYECLGLTRDVREWLSQFPFPPIFTTRLFLISARTRAVKHRWLGSPGWLVDAGEIWSTGGAHSAAHSATLCSIESIRLSVRPSVSYIACRGLRFLDSTLFTRYSRAAYARATELKQTQIDIKPKSTCNPRKAHVTRDSILRNQCTTSVLNVQ